MYLNRTFDNCVSAMTDESTTRYYSFVYYIVVYTKSILVKMYIVPYVYCIPNCKNESCGEGLSPSYNSSIGVGFSFYILLAWH